MSTVLRSLRRLRRESGMTVLELVIALALLGIIVPSILALLTSAQFSLDRQMDRSASNDQARLAVEELDKEIRSGNLLYDPQTESTPYQSLRVYTQTNASTRTPGNRCVQWKIVNGELRRRDWSVTWATDGVVTPWRTVADHVVNATLSPPVRAFQLDTDPAKGYRCLQSVGGNCVQGLSRTLVVTLVVQQSAASGRPVTIQSNVTGRNTEFGYPQNVCTSIPPG